FDHGFNPFGFQCFKKHGDLRLAHKISEQHHNQVSPITCEVVIQLAGCSVEISLARGHLELDAHCGPLWMTYMEINLQGFPMSHNILLMDLVLSEYFSHLVTELFIVVFLVIFVSEDGIPLHKRENGLFDEGTMPVDDARQPAFFVPYL